MSTKYITPIHTCISNKLHTNIGSRPGIRQFSKKKYRSHIKIVGTRHVTWSKFHIVDSQSGTMVQI